MTEMRIDHENRTRPTRKQVQYLTQLAKLRRASRGLARKLKEQQAAIDAENRKLADQRRQQELTSGEVVQWTYNNPRYHTYP